MVTAKVIESVVWSASSSMLRVSVVCLAGWALERQGILNAPARKAVAKVCATILLPCLLFSKIAAAVSHNRNFGQWFYLPLWALGHISVGCVTSRLFLHLRQRFMKHSSAAENEYESVGHEMVFMAGPEDGEGVAAEKGEGGGVTLGDPDDLDIDIDRDLDLAAQEAGRGDRWSRNFEFQYRAKKAVGSDHGRVRRQGLRLARHFREAEPIFGFERVEDTVPMMVVDCEETHLFLFKNLKFNPL